MMESEDQPININKGFSISLDCGCSKFLITSMAYNSIGFAMHLRKVSSAFLCKN